MHYQVTPEQRPQIFVPSQKKTARKETASSVCVSQPALSRRLRRDSTGSGKYLWNKAHQMSMTRTDIPVRAGGRKRVTSEKRSQAGAAVQGDGVKTMTKDNYSGFSSHRKITEALKGTSACSAGPAVCRRKVPPKNAGKLIWQCNFPFMQQGIFLMKSCHESP